MSLFLLFKANQPLEYSCLVQERGFWANTSNSILQRSLPFFSFSVEKMSVFRLRVMTFNVHSFASMHGRKTLNDILGVIRSASSDICVLEEASLYGTSLSQISEATGLSHVSFHSTGECGPDFGNMILSKYPISDVNEIRLHEVKDGGFVPRNAVIAKIQLEFGLFTIVGTHLDVSKESFRRNQLSHLLEQLDDLGITNTPHMLCGDFNATRSADYTPEHYARICAARASRSLPAPRDDVTAALQAAGYRDAWLDAPGETESDVAAAAASALLSGDDIDAAVQQVPSSHYFAHLWFSLLFRPVSVCLLILVVCLL